MSEIDEKTSENTTSFDKKASFIIVTSRKGGVGKSTFSAHLGASLALKGKSVILVDCDFGVRCLDILAGVSDNVLFDLGDVAFGKVELDKALTDVPLSKEGASLQIISSPIGDIPSEDEMSKVFYDLATRCDIVIFDTPRDSLDDVAGAALSAAESIKTSVSAVVVMNPLDMALRAAEITGRDLVKLGIDDVKLLINFFEADEVLAGNHMSIIDLIDKTSIPLIGVVPFEKDIAASQSEGRLASKLRSKNAVAAYNNIAGRIIGEKVPLFSNFKKIKRRKILDK